MRSFFLEKLLKEDEEAFISLVSRYHALMLRLVMIYSPNRFLAEEVVQEAWLGVLQSLKNFEGRSSLKTWIFRILTNRTKTRLQREGRSVPFSSFSDKDEESSEVEGGDPDWFLSLGSAMVPARGLCPVYHKIVTSWVHFVSRSETACFWGILDGVKPGYPLVSNKGA